MGKLANTCAKNDIINRLSTGESSNRIAKDYDVSGQRIRQIKSENKEIIEAKKQELISQLPTVVDIVKTDLKANNKVSAKLYGNIDNLPTDKQLQLKTLLDKTNLNLLKIAGIFPTQSNSYIANQTNIQDNSTTISVEFQEYLDMKSKKQTSY